MPQLDSAWVTAAHQLEGKIHSPALSPANTLKKRWHMNIALRMFDSLKSCLDRLPDDCIRQIADLCKDIELKDWMLSCEAAIDSNE